MIDLNGFAERGHVTMLLNGPGRMVRDRLMRYASRLRFPKLLALAGAVFVVDLILPDVIPFVDEILLGLVTLLLATAKKRNGKPRRDEFPPGMGPAHTNG